MADQSNDVTKYISDAPEEQQEVMNSVRELIHQSVPQVKENFKWKRPVFSTEDDFAYLQSTKNHVNLGFYNGEDLDDPDNLLEGTGKRMRHVKMTKPTDVEKDQLRNWFEASSKPERDQQ